MNVIEYLVPLPEEQGVRRRALSPVIFLRFSLFSPNPIQTQRFFRWVCQ